MGLLYYNSLHRCFLWNGVSNINWATGNYPGFMLSLELDLLQKNSGRTFLPDKKYFLFPIKANYKIRNSHVIQIQQRRSVITTSPVVLPAMQSQLAALHHSSIVIPITLLLPRVQTTVAAPNRCIGCSLNRDTKRTGIHDSKRVSEDGDTSADY